jgi:protein SCO1/2
MNLLASTMEPTSSCRNRPANDIKEGQEAGLAGVSRGLPPRTAERIVIMAPSPILRFFYLIVLVFVSLFFSQNVLGQTLRTSQSIGITQKMGQPIPAGLTFADEEGKKVMLGDLIKKPAILTFVYYNCGRFCPQLLESLAEVFPQLELTADRDYQVITVSFDANDTPAIARDQKRNYLKAIGEPFPEDAWRFLTGDHENIQEFCDAVGFTFRKEMHGFAHPVALIILTPSRKISRYIPISKFFYGVEYPITFSAIELSHALVDASQEKIGSATNKEFLYCFPHEPQGQQKFYNILTIAGIITILCLILLFIYLSLTGRKLREGKKS